MKHDCYTTDELRQIGITEVGEQVFVDRSVRFYGAERIRIGSHVRIDAFSVLSAGTDGLRIGNFVHIAVGARFLGGTQIVLEDFSGVSAGVCVFGSNEDYSGGALTNPTIPMEFRSVKQGSVVLGKHAIVGANSVIMPNVTLGLAASVGALTFVHKPVDDFTIVSGNPMRKVGRRRECILDRERQFLDSLNNSSE